MFADPQKNVEELDLQSGSKVADFGAGSGRYALALAKSVGDNGKVFAVDIQKDILDRIKKDSVDKGFLNVEVVWGNLEQPRGSGLRDASLDAVIVSNILFQLDNKDYITEETNRVLKPTGKVLVVDWADSFGGIGPVQNHVISKNEALALFEKSGFKLLREIRTGDHHWGMILKKV